MVVVGPGEKRSTRNWGTAEMGDKKKQDRDIRGNKGERGRKGKQNVN